MKVICFRCGTFCTRALSIEMMFWVLDDCCADRSRWAEGTLRLTAVVGTLRILTGWTASATVQLAEC